MRQHGWALVAVAALALASCDRPTSSITSPVVPGARPDYLASTSSGESVYLLTGAGVGQTRSEVIGAYGGRVSVGANSLAVPIGAVVNPTRFTFVLKTQPYLAADLTAVDTVTKQVVSKFPVPLTLTLSYAGVKTSVDPARLAIYWIVDGQPVEPLPTTLDLKGKKLIAPVVHFTDYGPVGGRKPCGTPEEPCP